MKDDANLDGMLVAASTFLYFQTGTPASDDFQRAMREYGAGFTKEIGAAQAWAAGKLFEKAAADSLSATKEALLLGLWSIKNETLGGLTQPLTFNENQPAYDPRLLVHRCGRKGAWVSPRRLQTHLSVATLTLRS